MSKLIKTFLLSLLLMITKQVHGEQAVVIGLSQFINHPALDSTTQGVLDVLKSQPELTANVQNAQGNTVIAVQIAQNFVGQRVQCIVAVGTTSAQTAANMIKGTAIPLVFATVTDPVGAKLVSNEKQPEGQITGSSNFTPIEPQLAIFQKILPNLKNLGMIYNPSELNGTTMVKETAKAAKSLGIVIRSAGVSSSRDVGNALQSLLGKVDAFFISNDNTALSAFDIIVKMATEHKIPVFVSDTDLVAQGAIAAIGPNQYLVGQAAGQMVLQILNGVSVKDIPVFYPTNSDLYINARQAKIIGMSLSQEIKELAVKTYQP